ncbi:MAG: lipase family protein, partial [Chitinophagia bacterium]|nr:lipase family protein [Chitinophagia bacterium]
MKLLLRPLLLLYCAFLPVFSLAQALKPGFDAQEYLTMLRISTGQVDKQYRGSTPPEVNYSRVYRSPDMGLHNQWNMWVNKNRSVMVINLRGTTTDTDSWLENFYSAMVPATGTLQLDSNYTFDYQLAADPRATVHVGWTIGIGFLVRDIVPKIKEYYAQGGRQLIVEGHSQGGALSFLLTSYLHYQIVAGKLPADLVVKTYCSAAPKPGNLYYAYDYDFITRGGWSFTVVNSADWVPETPVTIQKATDLNEGNPFSQSNEALKKQKWMVRLYARHIYHRLSHTSGKAQHAYQKFLGKKAYPMVKKYLPYLQKPTYATTNNYVRAGVAVVLQPDEAYYQRFPKKNTDVFTHHLFSP